MATPASSAATSWTKPSKVLTTLQRRYWTNNTLGCYAAGEPWTPVSVPLRSPGVRELGDNLAAVQEWSAQWARATSRWPVRLEKQKIGGRDFGANQIPARIWIDSYEDLFATLNTKPDAATYINLLTTTTDRVPGLREWMLTKPLIVLTFADRWADLTATADWIANHATSDMYLRQIDIPGVDTKFIESNRRVLTELVDQLLPDERINATWTASDFARRYGFRTKPTTIRLRVLDTEAAYPPTVRDISLPVSELALTPPDSSTIYVIENEITFLAFPTVPDAVAIWGGGNAAANLRHLPWLAGKKLIYWGDIDTHGFAILNHLRVHHPHTESLLMDSGTLLTHRTQWVTEPTQSAGPFGTLTEAEAEVANDLLSNTFGPNLRLEQERVRYSMIVSALRLAADASPA